MPKPQAPATETPDVDRADLLRVVGSAVLVALPISLVAIGFLAVVDTVQSWVWETLPADLGYDVAPWWWAVPWLLLAGLLVALAISVLPGRGGHIPAAGAGGPPIPPKAVPGVILAALAGLPLGVVLGPEAPLISMGTGLAVWLSRMVHLAPSPKLEPLIGIAGAAAAVSVILGNPLTAVIFLAEAVAIAGGPVVVATVTALIGVGVGAVMFTGLGSSPAVVSQSLQLVQLDSVPTPDVGDLLWPVPVGVVAAVAMTGVFAVGNRVAAWVRPMGRGRLLVGTMGVGLAVAVFASVYALTTGRSPFDVASSGTDTLTSLSQHPASWGSWALVALLVFKGGAYALSLGAFRGGPIFPSILLGGAFGLLLSPLPGLGVAGGLAVGMAAFAAAGMRMPLSAVALTQLLFGSDAIDVFPEVALAAVTAFAGRAALDRRAKTRAEQSGEQSRGDEGGQP